MGKLQHFFNKLFRPSAGKRLDTYGNAPAAINPAFGQSSDVTDVQYKNFPNPTGAVTAMTPLSQEIPTTPTQDILGISDKPTTILGSDEEVAPMMQTKISFRSDTLKNPTRFPVNDDQVVSATNPHPGGLLSNARGVIINQPIMTEVHQYLGSGLLEKMANYIIPGAQFDSSDRDDPPRCHPDTRTEFLQQLQERVQDITLGTRIIWLFGPAGVGKSAIMQSLAEIVCPLPVLTCATLFFSRPNSRDDPKKVFTTLAYNFAVEDPEYRRYVGEKLAIDPGFLDKSLDEQFKRLFVTPFTSGATDVETRRWVVLLDGFDEMSSERGQCRILDLIRESLLPPITPLIWIIASRPEAHLQASFRWIEEQITCFWKLEVPINSEESLRSVEHYLRTEFAKVRHNYSDVVPSLWPAENDFLWLTKASSGLFIFASTLVDYVGRENPVLRLKHILSLIGKSRQDPSDELKTNPFLALDLLYTTIMSDIPPDSLSTTKTILGFYLLSDAVSWRHLWGSTPNLLVLCNILGFEQHAAYAALRRLHSVLTFPPPDEAHKRRAQFLHASFSDFLKDRSRSQSYYIDLDRELKKIWQCYVNTLKTAPPVELKDRVTLSWEIPLAYRGSLLAATIALVAQTNWFRIVAFSCHDSSCQHETERRLLVDTSELIDAFEGLRPSLLENIKYAPDLVCDWLCNHAPVAVRHRILIKGLNLAQLDENDLDNMFKGLCMRKWGCLSSGSACIPFAFANLSADRWNHVKQCVLDGSVSVCWGNVEDGPVNWDALANLLRPEKTLDVAQDCKVVIMRVGPMEHYAIIGPLAMRHYFGNPTNYLVCPYYLASHDSPPLASVQ